MNASAPVSHLRLDELLAHIGSDAVTPGAGAAGAVALALAAACAGKAVSITLKHHPDDPALRLALASFQGIARAALTDGDRDSAAFAAFIHQRNSAAIDRLVCEGERFSSLVSALMSAIEQIQARIQPNMAGDIVAARALAAAAQRIQERNKAEVLALR